MLAWLAALLVGLALAWLFVPGNPPKLLGVYSQPAPFYYLKFLFMRTILGYRQWKSRHATQTADLMNSQFGGGSGRRSIEDLESKHVLPEGKPWAADAVFFDGSNAEGWYFTLGTAQRQNNLINLFFLLRVPDFGTVVCPELEYDSNAESLPTDPKDALWITRSGFSVRCIEPMNRWRLAFKGLLQKSSGHRRFTIAGPDKPDPSAKLFPAEFSLEWTNFGGHFDFDVDISTTAIAHSLALEPWSRELFDKLQASHQSHYEQFGFLKGDFHVDDQVWRGIQLTSMRDHTITQYRNWGDLRRYIMMIYHLEDGTCIHTSLISMPETVFSHLEFGYVVTSDKRVIAVDRVHAHLANIGEDRNFPRRFKYSFDAAELHFDIEVQVIETVSFKMGLELITYVEENMCEFKVNGLNGYGFAEAEYRILPY